MKHFNLLFYSLIIGVVCFWSCSQEEVGINNEHQVKDEISVSNGMLIFRDQNVYQTALNSLKNEPREALDSWEKGFKNFTSQRFIFEKAIDEDNVYVEELEKQVELGNLEAGDFTNPEEMFAPYVENNKGLFSFTGEGGFSLTVAYYSPQIEYFLNKDGLVQIGDSIFQYKEGFIRIIKNGDKTKIASLESHTVSTENIMVARLFRQVISTDNARVQDGYTHTEICKCEGYSSGGGQRVRGNLYVDLWVEEFGSYNTSAPTAYYRAINEEHKFFSWRTKKTSSLRILLSNVNFSISSSATTISQSYINVDQGTGGSEQTEIFVHLYNNISTGYDVPSWTITTGGNAYFYGRDNTSCSIIGGCQKVVSAP